MNNIKYLYGLPIYIEKINPETYQKDKILVQIKNNYEMNRYKNDWNKDSPITTDLHNGFNEFNNKIENFKEVDYFDLPEKYNEIIKKFFKNLNIKNSFNYNYEIVNYTCTNENSFMAPHLHSNCSFSLVHYISFDEKKHIPTIFLNPYFFIKLLPSKKLLKNTFDNLSLENSWLYQEWTFHTKEDDIIIFPSVLEHYVRNLKSDKLRIVVSVNIAIK